MIARTVALLMLLIVSTGGHAQSVFAEYEFETDAQHKDFKSLTAQLRCLVCQNQNIADSNAPLAQDLRREIHEMLTRGESKKDVIDFMVQRYGEFVLYKPVMSLKTLALWFGPLLFFIIGVLVLWRLTKKQNTSAVDGPDRHAMAQARQLLDGADDKPAQSVTKQSGS